jgi:hypothetical protein
LAKQNFCQVISFLSHNSNPVSDKIQNLEFTEIPKIAEKRAVNSQYSRQWDHFWLQA